MKYSIKGLIFLAALIILPATLLTMAFVYKMQRKKELPPSPEPEIMELIPEPEAETDEKAEKLVNEIIENLEIAPDE